jgi:hypothetical protein
MYLLDQVSKNTAKAQSHVGYLPNGGDYAVLFAFVCPLYTITDETIKHGLRRPYCTPKMVAFTGFNGRREK